VRRRSSSPAYKNLHINSHHCSIGYWALIPAALMDGIVFRPLVRCCASGQRWGGLWAAPAGL
jgi:hypothetical protein